MTRPINPDLTKHTLNLRTGDVEKMRELFPNEKPTTMIRIIISKYLDNHFKKETSNG